MKDRFDHQKTMILPKAHYDWMYLRLQDFKTVSEYNSTLFKISSRLKLCGEKITDEDMLEKTFTTFHASNVLLQQKYKERRFTKYSELISCLLIAKQNNELLMKNHQSRPTGFESFLEVIVISPKTYGRGRGRSRGRGHGQNSRHYNNHPSNPSKGKTHFLARSGIMVRQNKKMEKMYIKNLSRLLKRLAIDVEWKDIGLVFVVRPNIW